jgi:hypothetical protein
VPFVTGTTHRTGHNPRMAEMIPTHTSEARAAGRIGHASVVAARG